MATTATTEAKQNKKKNKKKNKKEEGTNLLGLPTFEDQGNGRFKCVETGHELLGKDVESYCNSKKCRLGLIDYALSHNNPLLSMFCHKPLSHSKMICKLTGDTVNKSEEHIWKHMTGKRFLNKLEKKEKEKLSGHGMEEESIQEPQGADGAKEKKKKMKKQKQKNKDKGVQEIISEVRKSSNEESDLEEADFWMPPVGDHQDNDDGEDQWVQAWNRRGKVKRDM